MCRWNGKTLIQREIDLVIDSNAGIGGLLLLTQNRGTLVQTGMLDAYQLPQATSSNFSDKDIHQVQDYISILLRIDNTTVVAYVNNMGGTASKELVILTREQWVWCLERSIHITAVHLPGVLNTIANTESREMLDRTDWKLNPMIFQKFNNCSGPLEMDLFASRLSTHCPLYFSWRPDPYAQATDAFLQDWTAMKCYSMPILHAT